MFELKKYTAPDFSAARFTSAPDAALAPAPADGAAPDNFHAMSIFPEYFKLNGRWTLAADSRMDCAAVVRDGEIEVTEFRRLKKGDAVVLGRRENGEDGIFVHTDGFSENRAAQDAFAFRAKRSRETAFSKDYDELCRLLEYERKHGRIVWVAGPAFTFDRTAKEAFCRLIEKGYVHALLAGNALATHDIEGEYLGTALGQDIYTQRSVRNGHYNHLDAINEVRQAGGIAQLLARENIRSGIMCALEKNEIPYVLGGSVRDDGPLPEVCGDVYAAQDAMRAQLRGATTVICMATMLHSIAAGNMTPSFRVMQDGTVRQVYFYCVDVSEFAVNKLTDRGSLSSRGIVTNAQDFAVKLADKLCR